MAEVINNSKKRINQLVEFSIEIMEEKEKGKKIYEKYKELIENITPYEVLNLGDQLLERGLEIKYIKENIEKIMNIFHTSLKNYEYEYPSKKNPVFYYFQENIKLEEKLKKIKEESIIKQDIKKLNKYLKEIKDIEKHYIRQENILYPYLENIWSYTNPLKILWSLHDDVKKDIKELIEITEKEKKFTKDLNMRIGNFFFLIYGVIFKENLLIFPEALRTIPNKKWNEILKAELEMEFAFIEKPNIEIENLDISENNGLKEMTFKVETGELSFNQIELIFNNLAIDITFIDKNDEVKYFSNPKDRFFPRSPAIIGRKVQNCHPPESVHVVEKILAAFKSGEKNEADFWINMRGKTILIRYYALRDKENNYIGTIEVSQDITEIKNIKGDKRLLDWE
ncbi:hypothetical protein EV215_0734 [Hypnocyclicus thermotrophus]|uniref:Hemerythrin-like domain-containing protein n=1 Tax=Hypnocyclicus thermotrophus TaxID=1627895 RepID=A0AA46DZU9_9FUSO|nr:PAS domain-containing protein [Hypnocyclicus thermotrophus]TDT72038.1 hypothetical protein EV215_0734 [Hypnocyclicus thermotrophus]